MKKHIKDIFVLTPVPLICGFLLGGIFIYVAFMQRVDYADIVWDGLLGDIMPLYLGIVIFFTIGNIVYCTLSSHRERYSLSQNIFYTSVGLCFALLMLLFWINA